MAPFPLAEENDNGSAVCKEKTETFAEKPCMKRQTTRRELFDEFYAKYRGLPRYKRQAAIFRRMRPYFKDADSARLYVEIHMRKKIRSLIARRVRMMRKVNLQTFNYFVTFTYSDELHTEESFREKLKKLFIPFLYAQRVEIYRCLGTQSRKEKIAFPRCLLYSRRHDAGDTVREERL